MKDTDFNNIRKLYKEQKYKLLKTINKKPLNIVLLGAHDDNRGKIKKLMEKQFNEINVIVPEIDFPRDYNYSLINFEKFIFNKNEINFIFINVLSPGSAFEYGNFYNSIKISNKLILCIYYKYHHFYSKECSMLTNSYIYFDIKYGHVYPIKKEEEDINFKTFKEIITFFILYTENNA